MLLFLWFGVPNLCRMTHQAFDSKLFHEVHKPLHGSRCFDSHTNRFCEVRIKLSHVFAFVLESPVHYLAGVGVQHRQRLLASVQITSYNLHLGLLRSEHCWGEHRTVYSGRREADVVMTSIRQVKFPECAMIARVTWRTLRLADRLRAHG